MSQANQGEMNEMNSSFDLEAYKPSAQILGANPSSFTSFTVWVAYDDGHVVG